MELTLPMSILGNLLTDLPLLGRFLLDMQEPHQHARFTRENRGTSAADTPSPAELIPFGPSYDQILRGGEGALACPQQ